MMLGLLLSAFAFASSTGDIGEGDFHSLLQTQAVLVDTERSVMISDFQDAIHSGSALEASVRQRQFAMLQANRMEHVSLPNFADVGSGESTEELKTVANLTGEAVGNAASLTEAGYQTVVAAKSRAAMEAYVYRVLDEENLFMTKPSDLVGVLPYYDGECAKQSLKNLRAELRRGTTKHGCRLPWIGKKKGISLLHINIATETEAHVDVDDTVSTSGEFALLNEAGYRSVASTKNNTEMATFIGRVLKSEGLKMNVNGTHGLNGFVPYYSGECAVQSFVALVKELHHAAPSALAATVTYKFSEDEAPSVENLRKAIAMIARVDKSQISVRHDAVSFTVKIDTTDDKAIKRLRHATFATIQAQLHFLDTYGAGLKTVGEVSFEALAAGCGGGWVQKCVTPGCTHEDHPFP